MFLNKNPKSHAHLKKLLVFKIIKLLIIEFLILLLILFVSIFLIDVESFAGLMLYLDSIEIERNIVLVNLFIIMCFAIFYCYYEIKLIASEPNQSKFELSNIIELTGLKLGMFEMLDDEPNAYLSSVAANLIKFENDGNEYISRHDLNRALISIYRNKEKNSENIYFVIDNSKKYWIKILVTRLDNKLLGVVLDVTQEILNKRAKEYEVQYDSLTGLYNRKTFLVESKHLLKKNTSRACLVVWNLDFMNNINEYYGYTYGDECIKAASSIFKELGKNRKKFIYARDYGDEFLTFFYGFESKDEIREIVENIRVEILEKQIILPDGTYSDTHISSGLAWYPDDGDSINVLLKHANFSLYMTKKNEKGGNTEFDKQAYSQNAFLFDKKRLLYRIFEYGMLKFHFQPIVSAVNGEIFGFEGLMRPDKSLHMNICEVIALAKAEGMLYKVDTITIFSLLKFIAEHKVELGKRKIFINTVPSQVMHEKHRKELINSYSQYFSNIVFEITEHSEGAEGSLVNPQSELRKIGIEIAIDDYGAGYSNQTSLLNTNPQYVKIDRALIQNIDRDVNKQQLFSGIVDFSRANNIKVLAEGVETSGEMETSIMLGCDLLQGYYVARPSPQLVDISESIVNEIKAYSKKAKQKKKLKFVR